MSHLGADTNAPKEMFPRVTLEELMKEDNSKQKSKAKVFQRSMGVKSSPRKVGKAWSTAEHVSFLNGLIALGAGNWAKIAQQYVPTRNSTQIASHAQKFAQRWQQKGKRKSKFADIEAVVMPILCRGEKLPEHLQRGATNSNDGVEELTDDKECSPVTLFRPKAVRVSEPLDSRECAAVDTLLGLRKALKPLQYSNSCDNLMSKIYWQTTATEPETLETQSAARLGVIIYDITQEMSPTPTQPVGHRRQVLTPEKDNSLVYL